MSSDREVLDGVAQRVKRLETRFMRLCDALHVDPTEGKVRVVELAPNMVEVSALDVSMGDVLAFCRKSGINRIATIMYRGKVLGSVMGDVTLEVADGGD